MIDYGNEKLNQIFRDTWPNLGWARRETMSKPDKFAGNYEGPLYAPHPDLTKHSEYYYDYDRNDPNRQNPFMAQNTPEKDDAPWLNTQYDGFMTHEEMLEEAARREEENRPFYRFLAVDYFATGEGISHWLKICRNYGLYDGKDYEMERFKEFIGCDHYFCGIDELTEEEFVVRYASLIPAHITKMLSNRDQPCLDWETHFHVNYS